MSEFVFKLLLLFLPGIICSYFVDTFTNHKERTQFQFVINSYVYGLMAYGSYWLLVEIFTLVRESDKSTVVFLGYLLGSETTISFKEIFYVCIAALLQAALITYTFTHKLHFRLMQKLKITKKFGELDVWGFFMNSKDVDWITVRDLENNLMYDGWVQAFSDNSKEAEVLLGDVKVYANDTGEYLYDVDSQYLSLDRSKIVIEMRKSEA
ncbi:MULTISPECIES: hypothetical protein [Vibrio harveyi group]|uniref:hypothetical protein n=1 Tax=Vibrio harveyi group TaxID=717610 RepID=UPI0006A7468F|nr:MULTISPECIES: hypothetical protein [Vibrio harveyi group]MEA3480409.1 hypothetical protein [Pseudomonadota bacterium]KON57601.1 hypothetical protein ACX11_12315 [Vibrio parahaemolyticus]MBT0066999.1 hypothetical protein [Vibrio alginolyticus]MCX8755916.1 hypothetical protein [Vibrio parahaemolyticus]HCG8192239.1 hypothetical protein [Vibrio parahaemolyticus]